MLQFHIYSENVPELMSVSSLREKLKGDKNIPVLIGEWGLTDKDGNGRKASVAEVEKMLTRSKGLGYDGALIWIDDNYGLKERDTLKIWLNR